MKENKVWFDAQKQQAIKLFKFGNLTGMVDRNVVESIIGSELDDNSVV